MFRKSQLQLLQKQDYQKTLEELMAKINLLEKNPKFWYYYAWLELCEVIDQKIKEGWEFKLLKKLRVDFLKAFPKPNLSWRQIHSIIISKKEPRILEEIEQIVNLISSDPAKDIRQKYREISYKISKIFFKEEGMMGTRGIKSILSSFNSKSLYYPIDYEDILFDLEVFDLNSEYPYPMKQGVHIIFDLGNQEGEAKC